MPSLTRFLDAVESDKPASGAAPRLNPAAAIEVAVRKLLRGSFISSGAKFLSCSLRSIPNLGKLNRRLGASASRRQLRDRHSPAPRRRSQGCYSKDHALDDWP